MQVQTCSEEECSKEQMVNQEWWHMLVIPALSRLRQEDGELNAGLGSTVTACFKEIK
jgi:hypothetical protein